MPYYPPPSSSGGVNTITGTINADFGTEDDSVITTVASALITSANIKGFTYIPIETASTSIDDFKLNAVSFHISNIVDNTSFDITGVADKNASGIYQINYIITY